MSEAPKLNALIPELYCTSIKASVVFYTEMLGFQILYQRPEATFAMLERQGAQVMLDEYVPGSPRSWIAGPLEAPFGRGMNLDIRTDDVDELYEKVKASGATIFLPIEDKWYRATTSILAADNLSCSIQTAIFCASPAASERARPKQGCNLCDPAPLGALHRIPCSRHTAATSSIDQDRRDWSVCGQGGRNWPSAYFGRWRVFLGGAVLVAIAALC